jgi:hypothetical protein
MRGLVALSVVPRSNILALCRFTDLLRLCGAGWKIDALKPSFQLCQLFLGRLQILGKHALLLVQQSRFAVACSRQPGLPLIYNVNINPDMPKGWVDLLKGVIWFLNTRYYSCWTGRGWEGRHCLLFFHFQMRSV